MPVSLRLTGATARSEAGLDHTGKTDEMADGAAPTRKKRTWSWVLWWMIDEAELERQTNQYGTLKIHQSARGQSMLLTLVSALISTLMIELVSHDRAAYLDSVILAALGVFILFGHR